jgi:HlyD family secretion protein
MSSRLRSTLLLAALLSTGILPLGRFGTCCSGESWFAPAAARPQPVRNMIARLRAKKMPVGIVKTNGRIEATQVDVSAKYAGRLADVSVDEGSSVKAGQIVGRVTSPEYEAQLKAAQSEVERTKQTLTQAEAEIASRQSSLDFAKSEFERGTELIKSGAITQKDLDQLRRNYESSFAAVKAMTAQRDQALSAITKAQADVERIQSILQDLVLVSPRTGRVQYLLLHSGEMAAAGAPVLTVLDLTDVYMTIFLPAADVGKLEVGSEARIVLDPAPQYVIPATVSFVAADAQFTPKTVETKDEREKLMFRVKLKIDPKLLQEHFSHVKTGVRGIGIVRTNSATPWPEDLQVALPK